MARSEATTPPCLSLPGFGKPLDFLPGETFPSAIINWTPPAFTVRERNMPAFIDRITDKPEWRRKVFEDEILLKWKTECLSREDWDFSEKMFQYCIAELQHKVTESDDTDVVTTLDAPAVVAKSDSIVPEELKVALREAVKPLEDVPDREKDWHPNSDEQVLDLVHPSLFPVIYGRTKIVCNSNVGVKSAPSLVGQGETTLAPDHSPKSNIGNTRQDMPYWSTRFQWLPCDVTFTDSGIKISSYINNLHPVHHAPLYPIIEQYISKAIPLWNAVLRGVDPGSLPRIHLTDCHDYDFPWGSFEEREVDPDEPTEPDNEYWSLQRDWEQSHRVLVQPEPPPFEPIRDPISGPVPPLDLRAKFETGLQVIVKLANIHLTPEKRSYAGGSWHVEGMLNEHICATALYYYDCDNITESHLAFRQQCDTHELLSVAYDQGDYSGVEEIYDVEQDGPGIQEIGSVIAKEGRMLAFPNVVQHRVMPFKLADKTKPGHRKILALFLVDPHVRVISSANVPPQQRDWWAEVVRADAELNNSVNKLPNELFEETMRKVTDFPISLEEAKSFREELMSERSVFVEAVNEEMAGNTFFFCEH